MKANMVMENRPVFRLHTVIITEGIMYGVHAGFS